jgi:hypothetical protein
MPKIGRNDPCHCGSGKKYKFCHGPSDEQQEGELRKQRKAQDTLLPKLFEVAQQGKIATAIGPALERYWDGKYSVKDLSELDDHEDRGADRFLTWFVFDYPQEDGRTIVERVAGGQEELELDPYERQLIEQWQDVHLRPYTVVEVQKGAGFTARDMLTGVELEVRDHAAAKRVEQGEVVVTHLAPAGGAYFITGAAAHLTPDTHEKMEEFIQIHRQAFEEAHPEATAESFVRAQGYLFNHFVMALPREVGEPSRVEELLEKGRISLLLAGEALGLRRSRAKDDEAPEKTEEPAAAEETEG